MELEHELFILLFEDRRMDLAFMSILVIEPRLHITGSDGVFCPIHEPVMKRALRHMSTDLDSL